MAARPPYRPYSQLPPQPKRIESHSSRDAIFEPYKDLIQRLYVQERMDLATLMEHMRENYGLVQTMKPWKTKLGLWGYKHHLTKKDAAHILRCLIQSGQEAVMFSGSIRRREDITKYIQRSKDLADEEDLLSKIKPHESIPTYIQPLSVEQTPPSTSTPGSMITSIGSAEISPLTRPVASPEGSARSSGELERLPSIMIDVRLGERRPVSAGGIQGILAISQPFYPWPKAQGQVATRVPAAAPQALEVTVGALSAEPVDLGELGVIPPDDHRHNLGFDSHGLGDYSNCAQVSDVDSCAARFVNDCLLWCYCSGQDNDRYRPHAEYHLGAARVQFVLMLQDTRSPGEECLAALSVMTALFESLGHTRKLLEILTECEEQSVRYFDEKDPLTKTIAFWKYHLACRENRTKSTHNVDDMWDIYEKMRSRYPNSHGPALTARYNYAWAMLEMQQYEKAKQELEIITDETEAYFGPDHLQSIMAAATLARATLHCGDVEKAKQIIAEKVCCRVENNFPRNHPYSWEANHRQAYFLFLLAQKADEKSRVQHLWKAEKILREVVIARRRVLGDSNPKSGHSFGLLKSVLEARNRHQDARELANWCEYTQKEP